MAGSFRQEMGDHCHPAARAGTWPAAYQLSADFGKRIVGSGYVILEKVTESADPSKPDEIQNPKLHLKHLLGERVYTAVISEEIARNLKAETIAQRSPSFRGFLEAVRNGKAPVPAEVGQ
jgi:hypothetical protein